MVRLFQSAATGLTQPTSRRLVNRDVNTIIRRMPNVDVWSVDQIDVLSDVKFEEYVGY
jgi:hypothetical protein